MLSADLSEAFDTLDSIHREEGKPTCKCDDEGVSGGKRCNCNICDTSQKTKIFGADCSNSEREHVREYQKVEAASVAAVMVETEISRLKNSIAELEEMLMHLDNDCENDISVHPEIVIECVEQDDKCI